MSTAIVGVGNIGAVVAGQLVAGGEPVVLTSKDDTGAESLAKTLGPLARAASVDEALSSADAVVFAVWLDTMRELVAANASLLENKTIIDPSNPIGFDASGQIMRTLPEGQSAASVIASLLPPNAHYVKAFGTLGATDLAQQANRELHPDVQIPAVFRRDVRPLECDGVQTRYLGDPADLLLLTMDDVVALATGVPVGLRTQGNQQPE